MKRTLSAVVAAAAALMLALCLAGCSSSSQNYKPESKSSTVSDSQLVKSGTLTVGVNASNPPMAGQTSTYVGIDVDIAAAMADELGLKLNIVDVKNDPAAALSAGTVDLVLGIDSTDTYDGIKTSSNYLQTGIALFSTKASASVPSTTSNSKFAAQASSVSAWNITNLFGANALTSTTDLSSAFSDLKDGTVDFAVADAVVGMYSAHSSGLDVYIIGMVTKPGGYCAGVAKTNTNMQTIVESTLKTLSSNGMINVIEKKWLGTTLALTSLPVLETTLSSATSNTNTSLFDAVTNANKNNTNSNATNTEAAAADTASDEEAAETDTEAA